MALDGNLNARLKEQISRENETIQSATSEQLDAMRSELSSIYSGALSTIEADMQSQSRALAKRFRRLMLLPSLLLVMISLIICGGAWAMTLYQAEQISDQRQTLRNIETLGVEPVRQKDGLEFLKLPEGVTLSKPRQTEGGQTYVQLKR